MHAFLPLLLPLVLESQSLNTPLVNLAPTGSDNALRLVILTRTTVICHGAPGKARRATAESISKLYASHGRREGVGVDRRGHKRASPGREEGDPVSCQRSRFGGNRRGMCWS